MEEQISDYIERNKDIYYDMLTRVRTHNTWTKKQKKFGL